MEITDQCYYIQFSINTDWKTPQNLKLEANFCLGRITIFNERKEIKKKYSSFLPIAIGMFLDILSCLSNFICLKIVTGTFHLLKCLKVPWILSNEGNLLEQSIYKLSHFVQVLYVFSS